MEKKKQRQKLTLGMDIYFIAIERKAEYVCFINFK